MEGRFYEGFIECKGEPDPEAFAQAVNFLRSSDVAVKVGAGSREGGAVRYPFLIKEPDASGLLGASTDSKESVVMLKNLFEGCEVSYRKARPNIRRAELLKACASLSATGAASEFAEAADFMVDAKKPTGAQSDPFARLVGMEGQKRAVRELACAVAKHGRGVLSSCHLAFLGRPGTGKTELARCLLDCFDQTGVTDGSRTFVKADAVNLIGRYVGETPRLVRDAVLRADGGVLFIDEAYRLANPGNGGNAYAPEAVNTLVEMLESRRERFVCVLAGYPQKMEELFEMNPGLRDRIGFRVAFPDYSIEELERIFLCFAAARGFEVVGEARARVREACRRLARLDDFANARTVRRLFERCVIKASCRPGRAKVIRAQDVDAAMADADVNGSDVVGRSGPVGFTG